MLSIFILRYPGIPRISLKLPSRNWLIFWTISGSFVSTLLYDRYHTRRVQQKWCNAVSYLAEEPLPPKTLPRRITIFLAAPPGDSIRAAREHFHEYIKPILVAGALDWEVVEGRREGEVRAGLAEKIRKLRKRNGEAFQSESSDEPPKDENKEELLYHLRQASGVVEGKGIRGDLILGRHTWKEYIRGLHEGWLGHLHQPSYFPDPAPGVALMEGSPYEDQAPTDPPAPEVPPKTQAKPQPTSPYISPTDYSSCTISPVLSTPMDPSLPLPLPHLLGFFNTPVRIYRFLTRRRLADDTGRSVAALVIASHSRPYGQSAEYTSPLNPDENSPSAEPSSKGNAVGPAQETWEQEAVLRQEEEEWHKSAWTTSPEGEAQERIWQEPLIIDNRIGERMRRFILAPSDEDNAAHLDAQRRRQAETVIQKVCKAIGWIEKQKGGWEMGLQGEENE